MLASGKDEHPHYDPGNLLDTLQRMYNVSNDRQLAIKLNVQALLLPSLRTSALICRRWF
jgi:hypothetical protein